MALLLPLTAMAQKDLPYEYGFETALADEGWTVITNRTNTSINTSFKNSGSSAFRFFYSDTPPQYLISPELNSGTDAVAVTFYYRANSLNYEESFQVGYSTTTADVEAFTWDDEVKTNSTAWTVYEGSYPAGTKYVAVKYTANDMYALWLDDITISKTSSCLKPKGLAVDGITVSSAQVTWTAEGGLDGYNLRYKAAADEEYTTVEGITEGTYTLEGLTQNTGYEVSVQAVCSAEEQSDWATAVSFTTLENCQKPSNYDYSLITSTARSVTLGWILADEEQDAWQISYSTSSGFNPDEGTIVNVNTNPATIEGLTPETRYYFTVRAFCGGDEYSSWMPTINRTTPASCVKPTSWAQPIVQNVTSLSFAWTPGDEEQDAWQVAYWKEGDVNLQSGSFSVDDPAITTVMTNQASVTINDLLPGTTYYFAVRAFCGGDDYSAWLGPATLATLEAYPAPTGVAAENIGSTNADITWAGRGDETSWNLRYRPIPEGKKLWDFENGLGDWTNVVKGEGTGWNTADLTTSFEGTYTAHSGTHVAITRSWSSSAVNADNWLISPELELGGTLSYCVMDDGIYHEYYTVMISTEGNEPENFSLLYEPAAPPTDTWQQVTIDLSEYEGKKGYIAFHHVDYDQDFLLIDDIALNKGEETPWTEVTGVTAPYTLEGLTPETMYEVEVQAVFNPVTPADEPVSQWAGTTLTTLSAMAPLTDVTADNITATTADIDWTVNGVEKKWNLRYRPMPEGNQLWDFEGGLGDWTNVVKGEGNGWTAYKSSQMGAQYTAHSGSQVAMTRSWYSSGAVDADNWLISPELELGGTLSYWVMDDGSYHEYYTVMISTEGNEPESFSLLYEPAAPPTYTWKQVTIDLSEYEGKKGYIAFHHEDNDQDFLFIDDVSIAFENTNPWTEVNGVAEHPMTLNGLEGGTTYEVEVQAVYDDGATSDWVAGQFTTTSDLVLLDNDFDLPEGQKNTDKLAQFVGKTANVTLSGRTLYKDGSWNTIILPFKLTLEEMEKSPLAGAEIKWVQPSSTVEGTHVTLYLDDEDEAFYADYPYFVRWESGENITDPTFEGVTITTAEESMAPMSYDYNIYSIGFYNAYQLLPEDQLAEDEPLIYYMSSDNKLRFTGKPRVMGAFRHGFIFRKGEAGALSFTIYEDGAETTGIAEIDGGKMQRDAADGVYSLQGVKLNAQPKQKGVYIVNGKKVVIK